MNSEININNSNNISFNSRYLKIIEPEKFPKELLTSIKANKSLDEFIKEGQPKNILEKLKDLFKKDEYIGVYFNRYGDKTDPYVHEVLTFIRGDLKKDGLSMFGTNSFTIEANESGKQTTKNPTHRIKEIIDNITNFKEKLSKPYPEHIEL